MCSGHTPATASAGVLNQVEGSWSGPQPSSESYKGCLPKHATTGSGGLDGRDQQQVQRLGRRFQKALWSAVSRVRHEGSSGHPLQRVGLQP